MNVLSPPPALPVRGLARPGRRDVRAALARTLRPEDAEASWRSACAAVGVEPADALADALADDLLVEELVDAVVAQGGLARVCGHSLRVRLRAHRALSRPSPEVS